VARRRAITPAEEPQPSRLEQLIEHAERRRALLDRIHAASDAGDLAERGRLRAQFDDLNRALREKRH
jgi:hypothetical protein